MTQLAFPDYPDVVTIPQLMHMLNIGRNTAYSLLKNGCIRTIKIGNRYIIPKKSVIAFLETATA